MGCDIHMNVEVRRGGAWVEMLPPERGSIFIPDGESEYDYDWQKTYSDNPENPWVNWAKVGRNYDAFAILANVRNGYGFAGVDTGNGFKPIDEPRGLPDDVSDSVQRRSDEWDGDGHSHSWFMIHEVLDYDYAQTTRKRGVLDVRRYKDWDKKSPPYPYCGAVSGRESKTYTQETVEGMLAEGHDFGEPDSDPFGLSSSEYVSVEWEETYEEAMGSYLEWFKDLHEKFGDDCRIVFWFDN